MKIGKQLALGTLGMILSLGFVSSVQARENAIYGLNESAQFVALPSVVCVLPGQKIRFRADLIDTQGRHYNYPANAFVWRITQSSGFWQVWDASSTFRMGAFDHGAEAESIYVTVPESIGHTGRLEAVVRNSGLPPALIQIEDASSGGKLPCQWADPSIYIGGLPPQ